MKPGPTVRRVAAGRSGVALLPWLVRLAWLSLPATAGTLLGDALDGRSDDVVIGAAALAWAVWAVVLFALLVPRPVGLVGLRVGAIAAVVVSAWAALDSGRAPDIGWLVLAAVPAAIAFLPATGEWLVNGAAYGDERRYLLRPAAALLLGPILLAGAVTGVGLAAGPLLLSAHVWAAGTVVTLLGLPAAFVSARALVRLAERWVVLVPAGLVVKDHTVLVEPMLFRREDIERFGPAPAGSPATDLTAGTFGLALELRLSTSYQVSQVVGRGQRPAARELAAVLVTPTRPGALVAEAARRRIRVSD